MQVTEYTVHSTEGTMTTTIVAVAGGSGSGKTTFARKLLNKIGEQRGSIIYQDSYYIDQSHRFDKDGGNVNFDHPDSLEFSLMAKHLKQLKAGNTVNIPIYDFVSHSRSQKSIYQEPKDIIIVDGILILGQKELIPLFDIRIFIDIPEAVRFERRLKRDMKERGRTREGVIAQFENQVKPMHDQFVQPSIKNADIQIKMEDSLDDMVEILYQQII